MKKIYHAVKNSKLVEGKTTIETVGFFTDKHLAEESIKEFFCMGGPGARVIEIDVFETWQEFQGFGNEKLRQQALRKLTPQERNALGVESDG